MLLFDFFRPDPSPNIQLFVIPAQTQLNDLIPGMMLSNRRSETDLRNQTIGVENGSHGKNSCSCVSPAQHPFIFLSNFLITLLRGAGVTD